MSVCVCVCFDQLPDLKAVWKCPEQNCTWNGARVGASRTEKSSDQKISASSSLRETVCQNWRSKLSHRLYHFCFQQIIPEQCPSFLTYNYLKGPQVLCLWTSYITVRPQPLCMSQKWRRPLTCGFHLSTISTTSSGRHESMLLLAIS